MRTGAPRVAYSPALVDLLTRSEPLGFVVIGASGWIGRATLDLLHSALGEVAFRRRVVVLGSATRRLQVRDGLEVECKALDDAEGPALGPALVLHNGFLTRDKVSEMSLDDYVQINRGISARVEALCSRFELRGFMLPSSGAVYGADRQRESDLSANPYGLLKVEDEDRFQAIAEQAGASFAAPRIFGLSGEYINKTETYVLADVIRQFMSGDAVRLRATRPVYRSYIYVGDLLELTLKMLLDDSRPRLLFDTAGEEVVEVGQLARLVADVLGRPEVPIFRDFDETASSDRYVGDGAMLFDYARRWEVGLRPLAEQIRRTADFLLQA